MRLIDADALHAATCAECTLQGSECLGDDYCDWDSIYHINHAPTIDAIPVEWLREKMRGYASSLKSTETAALVMVMQMWQKEQEKQGIEPKEGK